MVVGFILGLFKPALKEKEPEVTQVKPPEQKKSASLETFLGTAATKKFLSSWKKKGYTKRGMTKLFLTLWMLHDSDKNVRNAANDILSSLIGADALGKLLGALKLAPEGLVKGLKK